MTENYGKILDNRDLEQAQSLIKQNLFGRDINELRRKCFGKVVQRIQQESNTVLSGQAGVRINDFAPFLYFHDSITLDLCPGCPQAIEPSLLEPYLERGLVTVYARTSYQNYIPEFQELAYRYPEYFLGTNAMVAFKLFRLNKSFPHDPKNKFCLQCSVRQKLERYEGKLQKFGEDAELLGGYMSEIFDTPVLAADYAADLFIDTLNHYNNQTRRELEVTVNLMGYLTTSNALCTVPQFEAGFLGRTNMFLEPLRISHRNDLDLNQYLDVIKEFKGTLSPTVIPEKKDKILSRVLEINEEIDKIQSSKRRVMASFLSSFQDIPSVLTRIATHGTYGAESVYKKAIKGYRSPRLSKIRSKILSRYYGVSEVGAQIWQIREQLKHAKKSQKN